MLPKLPMLLPPSPLQHYGGWAKTSRLSNPLRKALPAPDLVAEHLYAPKLNLITEQEIDDPELNRTTEPETQYGERPQKSFFRKRKIKKDLQSKIFNSVGIRQAKKQYITYLPSNNQPERKTNYAVRKATNTPIISQIFIPINASQEEAKEIHLFTVPIESVRAHKSIHSNPLHRSYQIPIFHLCMHNPTQNENENEEKVKRQRKARRGICRAG